MEATMFVSEWQEITDLIIQLLPIVIPLAIISLVLTISAIVGIAKKPNPWGEKILWLLIVILIDVIGPVLYFAIGSGMLDEKFSKAQDAQHNDYSGGNV
jgi:multisubunit Na+/H+ antiporter MnhG subunit